MNQAATLVVEQHGIESIPDADRDASVLDFMVCVYGFRLMLLVNKVAVVANSLIFIVGLVALSTESDK